MSFSWTPFFDEMLDKILEGYNKNSLAKLALEIFGDSNLNDKFKDGSTGTIKEFDPLTFIGFFNRNWTLENRIYYCKIARDKLKMNSLLPSDFNGIPIINPQKSWFFPFEKTRKNDDIDNLWSFSKNLQKEELNSDLFEKCLAIDNVGIAKLTQISFIIKPKAYFPLDKFNLDFLENNGIIKSTSDFADKSNFNFDSYYTILKKIREAFPNNSFAELSHNAKEGIASTREYWLLGATWGETDKSNEFIKNSEWINGFEIDSGDKSIDKVKEIAVGDFVAIKSAFVKERKISCIRIKAIGVVTENLGDGKQLKIEWSFKGPAFDVDGAAYMQTVHKVTDSEDRRLIFHNSFKTVRKENKKESGNSFVDEGFMKSKNVIFYGPPGTGKTFNLIQIQEKFRTQAHADKDQLISWIQGLSWWEVTAATLIDLNKAVSVPELMQHEFIQLKIKQSSNKSPQNTLWVQLQTHTVSSSKTVSYERRQEPLIVDKDSDSKWSLVADWKQQLGDLIQEVQSIRSGSFTTIDNNPYSMVTFHQSYSYEEFVEGIRPERTTDGTGVTYQVKDGIFKLICKRAIENPDMSYAIFIDEINRGNISKIFGELITLIEEDKRLGAKHEVKIKLPYSGDEFGVPENLYIIGTMNSVDRSIALVDMALRRRFEFITIRPNSSLIDEYTDYNVNPRKIFEKLNNKISVILGSEYQIGHSYFMNEKSKTLNEMKRTWFGNVLPLLQEYLFDDWDKLEALVGKFVVKTEVKELEKVSLPRFSFGAFVQSDISDKDFVSFLKELE